MTKKFKGHVVSGRPVTTADLAAAGISNLPKPEAPRMSTELTEEEIEAAKKYFSIRKK
jgi:hypothetical protein